MLSLLLILGALCISGTSQGTQQLGRSPHVLHLGDALEVRQQPGPFTPSQTSTGPSPSGTNSPVPVISFHLVPVMTTCSTGVFTWDYVGPSGESLSLNITNIEFSAPKSLPSPPSPTKLRRQAAGVSGQGQTYVVASNLDPASGQYNWSKVAVPPGWYVLAGTIGNESTFSPLFLVSNGSDTSCLSGVSPAPSSASTSSSSSSSPSSTSTTALSSGATSKVKTGAIVGGVIGGVVLVALACLAFFLFRIARRSHNGNAQEDRWGGLRSVDSSMTGKGANVGSKAGDNAVTGAVPAARSSTSHHDPENVSEISHEKLFNLPPVRIPPTSQSPPTSYSNPFEDGSASVLRNVRRTSNNSTLYSFSQDPGTEATTSPTSPSDLGSNLVLPPPRRSSLNSIPSSTTSRRRQTPSYPPPNEVEMERLPSSSSAKGAPNKTPRKPVPKYVASVENLPYPGPISNSLSDSVLSETSSESRTNSVGPEISDPSLKIVHKDSIGDLKLQKPVHYLVPDMPPPQKD